MLNLLSGCTLVRFFMSGGTAATISIGTVYVMTHVYTYHYLLAATVGFLLAVTFNFLMQKLWTFRERSVTNVHRQSAYFFTINGLNFLLNAGLMLFLVEKLHLWPVVAQFLAAMLLAAESFVAYSLIFKQAVPAHVRPEASSAGDYDVIHTNLKGPRMDC